MAGADANPSDALLMGIAGFKATAAPALILPLRTAGLELLDFPPGLLLLETGFARSCAWAKDML
jgi:hypothetical protein